MNVQSFETATRKRIIISSETVWNRQEYVIDQVFWEIGKFNNRVVVVVDQFCLALHQMIPFLVNLGMLFVDEWQTWWAERLVVDVCIKVYKVKDKVITRLNRDKS